VNEHNRQSRNTLKTAIKYRINKELKYLYVKRQKLNEKMYRLHLNCAKKKLERDLAIYTNDNYNIKYKMYLQPLHMFRQINCHPQRAFIKELQVLIVNKYTTVGLQ
jgi:hypothetical protein